MGLGGPFGRENTVSFSVGLLQGLIRSPENTPPKSFVESKGMAASVPKSRVELSVFNRYTFSLPFPLWYLCS